MWESEHGHGRSKDGVKGKRGQMIASVLCDLNWKFSKTEPIFCELEKFSLTVPRLPSELREPQPG